MQVLNLREAKWTNVALANRILLSSATQISEWWQAHHLNQVFLKAALINLWFSTWLSRNLKSEVQKIWTTNDVKMLMFWTYILEEGHCEDRNWSIAFKDGQQNQIVLPLMFSSCPLPALFLSPRFLFCF